MDKKAFLEGYMSKASGDNAVIYAPAYSGTRWDPRPSDMGPLGSNALYRQRLGVPNGVPVSFDKSVLKNSMIMKGDKAPGVFSGMLKVDPSDLRNTWGVAKAMGRDAAGAVGNTAVKTLSVLHNIWR
jgi:hypothetical protein